MSEFTNPEYLLTKQYKRAFESSTIEQLIGYFQQEIDAHGTIHSSKDTGLFESFRL